MCVQLYNKHKHHLQWQSNYLLRLRRIVVVVHTSKISEEGRGRRITSLRLAWSTHQKKRFIHIIKMHCLRDIFPLLHFILFWGFHEWVLYLHPFHSTVPPPAHPLSLEFPLKFMISPLLLLLHLPTHTSNPTHTSICLNTTCWVH